MPGHWFQQLQNPSHPVRYVSWYEAMAYSAWIGAQLLTEAQWERAARGTEGREYPWGTAAPDSSRANYDKQHSDPTAAGYYPLGATPEGVYDMAGNVFEWVQDVYDEYSIFHPLPIQYVVSGRDGCKAIFPFKLALQRVARLSEPSRSGR